MGRVTVANHVLPESIAWAVGGMLAAWVLPTIGIWGVLWVLYPWIGLLLLALFAVFTWTIRHRASARGTRAWAACGWFLAAGVIVSVAIQLLPNGRLVPTDPLDLVTWLTILFAPPVVAVIAFEAGRRVFWDGVT